MTLPLRILIVKDSADDAEVTLLELARGGIVPDARRVESAAEMRTALAEGPWDAVLSDYTMPGFGASEAFALCRAADPDLPFIVVSGTIGEQRAVEMMRAGAVDYLLKGNLTRLPAAVLREVQAAEGRRGQRGAVLKARKLAAIVASSYDAIVGKTLDGIVTSWNAGAERLYGYAAGEIVGRSIALLISPDRPDEEAGLLGRAARGERVEHFETERVRKDGTRVHVSISLSPVRDEASRIVGASSIARDISDRKRDEERLRKSESFLRLLWETSADGMRLTDGSGVVRMVNEAYCRMVGRPREQLEGRPLSDVYLPVLGDEILRENCERFAARTIRPHYETEVPLWDGRRVWFALSSSFLDIPGNETLLLVLFRDITDQKRAEQELRRTSDLLRAVADGTPDAIFVKDLAGRYLLFNEAASRFVGKPVGEVLGRDDTALFGPADAHRVMDRDRLVVESGRGETDEEVLTAAGATRTYLATKAPYRDGDGSVIGVIGISRDITDQKEAEVALRASEARKAAILETALDCIITIDHEGNVVEFNAAAERTFGYRRAEVLGKDLANFIIPPSLRERHYAGMARYVATGEGTVVGRRLEIPAIRADGTEFPTELALTRIAMDGPPMFTAYVRDITDRKRAGAELRASEDRYRTLLERIPDPLIVYDQETLRYLAVNDAAVASYGYTRDEFLGMTIKDIRPAGDVPALLEILSRSPGGFEDRGRWKHRKKNGTLFDVEITAHDLSLDGRRACIVMARDVTVRLQAEDAIRESEARYRSLADAMPQIVWATRPDGYHEFYNRQWYDYTGLTFGETEGEAWNAVFHPDDQPIAWEKWRHSLATGDPYEIEYRLRRHDGEYRWFLGRALPQRDGHGEIVRWFGTCTDIHDFKQAQAERYATLARLNLQIDRMPLAYMLTGPDFRYTRWNPAAERIFGFAEAEVVGRHPFDVVVPAHSRPLVGEIFGRLEAGDMNAHGTCENLTKEGRIVTCEWYNTPLFNEFGIFTGVLSLAQDVTERKRLEEQYHQTQRRLHHVVASSPVVLFTLALADDQIRGIDWIGENLLNVLGHRPEAALSPGWWQANVHPEDLDHATAQAHDGLFSQGHATHEYRFRHGDGGYRWTRDEMRLIRDDTGRPVEVVGSWSDITERKSLEEQFRQAQKMEAVGQLAGGVAHDFNNLLTVINGYGEILHAALPPDHPSREMVAEIQQAGNRAAGLTRQLLAFSRQTVLEARVLDLNTLVRNLESMLQRLIGEDVDLVTRLGRTLGRIKADSGQLEQAIVNLCVNARDAMPRGGQITIETHEVELDETYAASHPEVRPGPYALIAVTDTGAGMTREVQARIFEPFYTTKGVGKGTGLGLAMVFGFAKQSGGHVAVYSELGRGATFKLYLPIVAETPLERPTVSPAVMPKGTETVLLVEDEDAVRALARHILRLCGYNVLEAGHGREAVRIAAAHTGPIHLLVTDVVMPGGMGGREVAEAVVALHPEARVLFASGYTDDAVVRHGVIEAETHFLQKPFAPAALAGKVRAILDAVAEVI